MSYFDTCFNKKYDYRHEGVPCLYRYSIQAWIDTVFLIDVMILCWHQFLGINVHSTCKSDPHLMPTKHVTVLVISFIFTLFYKKLYLEIYDIIQQKDIFKEDELKTR